MPEEYLPSYETKKPHIHQAQNAEQYIASLTSQGSLGDLQTFQKVIEITKKVKELGGNALLVGGSVRDELLGSPVTDFDLEVYGIEPDVLRNCIARFGDIKEAGKAFGVIKLRVGDTDIDISLPRKDSKTGDGHKDFSIDANPHMSIEEAARRRDFTMNSLAKDPQTGEIYDYFGGIHDIQKRILRVTDYERFQDDPLRVLRAIQFIGRMGLAVDDKSASLIRDMRKQLRHLPKKRFREEWIKLFLKSRKPSLGLQAAMEFGIFHELHENEIVPLRITPQEPQWHPEGDVWIHTLMVTDEAVKIVERENLKGNDALIVLLGAFCHDLGKPPTTEVVEGKIRSLGHEEAGVAPSIKFLSDIGIEASLREPIIKTVADHLKPSVLWQEEHVAGRKVSDNTIRKLAERIYPATIEQLLYVAEADHLGRGQFIDPREPEKYLIAPEYPTREWLLERARKLNIAKSKPAPILMGRDLLALGFLSGPHIGEMIRLADTLRDEKEYTREQILSLIFGHKDKHVSDIIAILKKESEEPE